jgi:hypothetical protein
MSTRAGLAGASFFLAEKADAGSFGIKQFPDGAFNCQVHV